MALALLGVALPSLALTIGGPQAAIWIGKPLDLVVPLTLEASESSGNLCPEAEVVQGDTRIDDRRLTLSLEPGSSASASRLRLRSTMVIEEPVLHVTVRAGCHSRSVRHYVLLADVPPESATLPRMAAPTRGAAVGEASLRAALPGRGDGGRTGAGPAVAATRLAGPRRVRDVETAGLPQSRASSRRTAAVQAPSPAAAVARTVATGPRLQIDALESAPSREIGLQTSPSLALAGSEDPARRADAAAQWRALSASPDEARREAQRIQSLEATLAALREQTAQNERTLREMRSELAEARSSRYGNPLVYAMGLLLSLALIAIGLLWRLSRRTVAPAWWGDVPDSRQGERGAMSQPESDFGDFADHPATQPDALRPTAPDSRHAAPLVSTPHALDLAAAPATDAAAARPVNTEELFDVQQQSDFFLSLGQNDQAIAVLVEHIAANPDTSALAYLDLFKLYHALGRRDDYARLRSGFERAFNANVPAFDDFSLSGRGLEHYRGALGRIESQWPAASTLALIEELVFRKPGTPEEESFDLAAYQELLLLYAVAKEVIDPDRAPPASVTPLSFADTFSHEDLPTVAATLFDASARPMPPTDQIGAAPAEAHPASPKAPSVDRDLAAFDKTAFATIAAPLETAAPMPARDPYIVDFDLFDAATEAEITPRAIKRR